MRRDHKGRAVPAAARGAVRYSQPGLLRIPVLVNGAAGLFVTLHGKPFAVMGFTVRGEKIVAINIVRDHERLREIDPTVID
jgi:RNA polymerase sigma-70 factor (ECF subfamily)